MAVDVIMPQLGETVAEGKVASWFKQVGDAVARGDNLFLIETDKVTMEVQATTSGVLTEIRVPAGATVPVGSVVGVVGSSDVSLKQGARPAAPAPVKPVAAPQPAPIKAAPPAPAPVTSQPRPAVVMSAFDEVHTPVGPKRSAAAPDDLKITPLARRLISESGGDVVSIAQAVRARGGWRIAAADVRSAPAASAVIAPTTHGFQAIEVDFHAVAKARDAARQKFRQSGVTLTYLPFVARAVCIALPDFPKLNARFAQDKLELHNEINLGIAVDLDDLFVPVIPQACDLTAAGLARAIARRADKTRHGEQTPGIAATYTITDNGSAGTLFTMPILNPPQAASLSLGAVRKVPAVVSGPKGDSISIRPVATLGQSFDHRALDGTYAGAFLQRVKTVLETHDWAAELA